MRFVWILVLAFVVALSLTPTETKASHRNVDVCGQLDTDLAQIGVSQGGDQYEFAMNAVGCDADTWERQGNACNRLAYRLAKSYLYHNDFVLPYLEIIAHRVETFTSRGYHCEQYEDGSYGFPAKQVDCRRSTRC